VTLDDGIAALLPDLTARTPAMVELLDALVSSESPSNDPGRLAATADLLAERGTRLLGRAPQRSDSGGIPALCWWLPGAGSTSGPVLVAGHLDTVWPAGTLARWPFRVDDDRATGPGVFDMKAGLVQALFGLAALGALGLPRPPVLLLVTADEEVGSPGGRRLITSRAAGAVATLVPEASEQGRLKVARKGVSNYDLRIGGRAAHAGLEPHRGVNALVAAARLVLEVAALAAPELATTVTPTTASAGTTRNTVPATASVTVDVRAATAEEQQRVDTAVRGLEPTEGATLRVEGGIDRPPMEEESSAGLFALAQEAAAALGLPPLQGARVGGGSDGNLTAALGIPTLDGLGAVGAGAHAEGEYALVSSMPERAALLAALIVEIGRQHRETDSR
jgi:glutamate carboxypeptidase